MASENLVNNLFEIIQSNTKEKLSYDDFEKDLVESIHLPNDEMDRALSIMLSQAEVNPNVIGELKGGTFVISPSFSVSVVSTIKYENQFIEGKTENINRNSNNNIKADLEAVVLIMTPELRDAMIANYESLSSNERMVLWDNYRYCTDKEKKKINEGHKKALEEKADDESLPIDDRIKTQKAAKTVGVRSNIIEKVRDGDENAIALMKEAIQEFKKINFAKYKELVKNNIDIESVDIDTLIEIYEIVIESMSKYESSLYLDGKSLENVKFGILPLNDYHDNGDHKTLGQLDIGEPFVLSGKKTGETNGEVIIEGTEFAAVYDNLTQLFETYTRGVVKQSQIKDYMLKDVSIEVSEDVEIASKKAMELIEAAKSYKFNTEAEIEGWLDEQISVLSNEGKLSKSVIGLIKDYIKNEMVRISSYVSVDYNDMLRRQVEQQVGGYNLEMIKDSQIEHSSRIVFERMDVSAIKARDKSEMPDYSKYSNIFGIENKEIKSSFDEEQKEAIEDKSETPTESDSTSSDPATSSNPFFNPAVNNQYANLFSSLPMSKVLSEAKDLKEMENEKKNKEVQDQGRDDDDEPGQ